MTFSISGFVLEPPRVGQANSPYTQTPNNYIADQAAFDIAYPSNESEPRTDYFVFVFDEGAPIAGLLVNSKFGWSKNEIIRRFDYNAREGRFKLLPGNTITMVGILGPDSNTTRLKVKPPVQAAPWPDAPYRLSVGSGSGTTWMVSIVTTFGSPPPGTAELSIASDTSGELNWNVSDLTTFAGQTVQFQQQQFFEFAKSTGRVGFAPVSLTDPVILLNPKPGTGQFPLLRFGYGFYLQTIEVPNDGALVPDPAPGFVKWSLPTGCLAFNSTDAAANAAIPVYYDGVVFARDLELPRQVLGDIASPASIVGQPPVGVDLIFSLPNASPYYQFPQFSYLDSSLFNSGKIGVVQVDPTTGDVQFSASDQITYSGESVTVVFGDLPIERGISVRFLRTPVNLDGRQGTKDVTAIYSVENAVWADPIIGTPQVFLPSIPIDVYPLTLKVLQGQGTYVSDAFPRLDITVAGTATFSTFTELQDLLAIFLTTVETGCLVIISSGPNAGQSRQVLTVLSNTNLILDAPLPSLGGGDYRIYPASSLGYYIDFDTGTLYFAQRRNDYVIPIIQRSAAILLPDPLVLSGNLLLETDESGPYQPLVLGTDALFDPTSGLVSFTSTFGEIITQGTNASFSGSSFIDLSADFFAAGVLPGNLVEILTTAAEGIYTVSSVFSSTEIITDVASPSPVSGAQYNIRRGREVLADRYFDEVVLLDPSTKVERIRLLGTASNAPRLNVPVAYVSNTGIRFGPASAAQFATMVLVPDDGSFTSPPTGTVEISEATGNLNFSAADLGATVYWVRELEPKIGYTLSAGLGLIQFSERMLSLEEVLITYTTQPPSTDPPTPAGSPITEYATFLIRKEITADHLTPTSTLYFNTVGKYVPSVSLPVASDPSPAVFRGGRPQTLGTQCVVDTAASTITFLADSHLTDALPHGAIVNSNERVYIDYYVTQAVGGEKTTTVLHPPLLTAAVNINETDINGNPNNQFVVHGDQTASFPANYLLRIENEQVYLIGSAIYDAGNNQTTVTLYGNQVFQDSFTDPKVYVSSGATPITSAPLVPPYFVSEIVPYESIARGSNQFIVAEDRTAFYRTGTVVLFTDGASTFTDFLQVAGASYDVEKDRTTVSLTANAIRQYINGSQWLLYSVRPIFEPPTTEVQTSQVPALTQPHVVYRRTEGQPGDILSSPLEYTINDAGRVLFTTALRPLEEFSIFYTGFRTVAAGVNLRASYTAQIAPSDTNGLAGQVLIADYYILSPDTFYYRVETMTNFRGEYAQELETKTSGSSSGPQTSNISQPELFEKGRTSLYFTEKHLANQDIIARSSLLFYNTSANLLEAYLQALDGRVVGNNDGPFLFDGTTGTVNPSGTATFPNNITLDDARAEFTTDLVGRDVKIFTGANKGQKREIVGVPLPTRLTLGPALPSLASGKYSVLALNQIDDSIRISPAPYAITFPPFAVTSIGTYQKNYLPGALSRFYPTSRDFFGVPAITADTETGDEVLDTRSTNVTLVSNLHTRLAWAVLIESTGFSGPNTLKVDFADGTEPGFADQAEKYARPPFKNGMKCVVQRRDGSYINDSSSPVTISAVAPNQLTVSGLAAVADVGTTVYRSPIDDSVQIAPDILTYYLISRDYSFNGNNGQVIYIEEITALANTPLIEEQALSGKINITNSLMAPFKFPALYGGAEDDDGDLSFPIQSPDPNCEQNGCLYREDQIIHNPTGIIRGLTTSPFVSTGTLGPLNTITDIGPFPPPVPKVHDLARVLSGPDGASDFARVTVVGPNFITVDTPLGVTPGPVTYEIAVSAKPLPVFPAGTATFPNPTTLVDSFATFPSTAKTGETVVVTSGLNNGERRQIIDVVNNTTLTLNTSLPTLGAGTYRIDDSLATYGGSSSDYLTALDGILTEELTTYSDEQSYILDFLDQVFTDVVTSATGETTAASAQLYDAFGTFLASGISTAHFVYIVSGADAGIYQITNVVSDQLLEVDSLFPATLAGVSYQIVKLFGASKETIQELFTLHQSISTLIAPTTIFQSLITTRIPVVRLGVPDNNSFTRGTSTSDLDNRDTLVDARLSQIPATAEIVENVLANTDKVYDQRYVWIDARINLESGLVAQQKIAVENRIKAQEDFYNQLIKLLAVEES